MIGMILRMIPIESFRLKTLSLKMKKPNRPTGIWTLMIQLQTKRFCCRHMPILKSSGKWVWPQALKKSSKFTRTKSLKSTPKSKRFSTISFCQTKICTLIDRQPKAVQFLPSFLFFKTKKHNRKRSPKSRYHKSKRFSWRL